MNEQFDSQKAKEFLSNRSQNENEQREDERKTVLKHTCAVIEQEFKDTGIEVYLVGSILRPYQFTANSDIDIVVKNFTGDRFLLWTKLEELLQREVEIILFESCHFKDFITSQGLKVV